MRPSRSGLEQPLLLELLELGLELLHLEPHGPTELVGVGRRDPGQQRVEGADDLAGGVARHGGLLVEVDGLLAVHGGLDLLPCLGELAVYLVHVLAVVRREGTAVPSEDNACQDPVVSDIKRIKKKRIWG